MIYCPHMFTLQVIVSFVAGGLVIALQTLLGERVPLRWRGVALTIPTTMALGLFFIGLTKTPADVPQAVRVIPAALALDYLWVLMFALFSRFTIIVALVGSFSIWGVCAAVLVQYPPRTISGSILFYIPVLLISYWGISTLQQTPITSPVPVNWKHITIRSLIGGSIVAVIVILSKTIGNVWGGLFSVFPAAFTATFLIYYLVHGKKVIPSVAKSLFFPGAIGFVIYGVVAAAAFPKVGIWLGTLVAYAVSIPFYYFYTLVKIRLSKFA